MDTYTAFSGFDRVGRGPIDEVAAAVKQAVEASPEARLLIFSDRTGQEIDLDLRGSVDEVVARLPDHPVVGPALRPRRGRPRLGVVSREVSLLPRHWNWLRSQPRSASATMRRLIEVEMKTAALDDRRRAANEATHRFLWAMAGDLPGFEEVTRALDAGRLSELETLAAAWPVDVREHLLFLARGEALPAA